MYSVSNAFLEEVKKPVQTHRLQGTIGSYSFDKGNIVSGTFHITNQCTNTSDVVLGSVYMGQLECTFTGLNIGYTNWIGKTITPTFGLKIGDNSWEDVPLGVYRVLEAEHTAEGVHVVAYDNMRKFDRKFRKSRYQGTKTLLEFVAILCADCNIALGMTEEEFNALPNTGEQYEMFGLTRKTKAFATDIDTCRDLLFWIAQTMGCFATMDRSGQLVFRKYNSTIVDTISQNYRLTGAEFADYITNYTGIYVNNMRYETESYYGYDAQEIQAEMAIVSGELTIVDDDIQANRSALVELERKHDAHEITDEEYLAQKAVLDEEYSTLTKRRKQLQKHLNWLVKALEKAQAGEDGTSMDLGDNPFLQDEDATVRERERRRVLKAIDKISYTPFACSSVMGIHYDLGDVLYFTGGHAGDDGVFCCLMMYDWTFNGEYQMQGFGADPSIANVKTRTQKKAKASNANALAAKELSSGTIAPVDSDGKEDDIYIKYGTKIIRTPKYIVEYNGSYTGMSESTPGGKYPFQSDMLQPKNIEWDNDAGGYYVNSTGIVKWIPYTPGGNSCWPRGYGDPVMTVGISEAGTYRWHVKIRYNIIGNIMDESWTLGIGICGVNSDGTPAAPNMVNTPGQIHPDGRSVSVPIGTGLYEYSSECSISNSMINNGKVYVAVMRHRAMPTYSSPLWQNTNEARIELLEFYFEKVNSETHEGEGAYTQRTEQYIDKVYVKETDPDTGNEVWKEIEYLASADESEHSGLSVDERKKVSLTPEVMRAWFKADPPQVKRNFNQYCVRFTGKPDTNIEISLQNNNGWLNKSIKKDSEGVFTLKSGGTVSSDVIEYCAYKITGLTSGQRYYFNFKANFKDGTTFGGDFTKGLGVVFNTTGVISTDDWEGDPGTFDEENLYCSFRRGTVGTFYDFSFVATASTMYMCVVVADITSGQTSSLTLSKFVISKTERAYVRNFYIFDTVSNDWLPYKPWGSGSDSGDAGASSLGDLDDVNLDNLSNGQTLYYNSTTGEWVNGDSYELPIASANVLGGIKVGANLSIDENGILSATDTNTDELSELTDVDIDDQTLADGQVLKYDGASQKWKNGTGGSGGASSMSDLTDVDIDDQTLDAGQVLKWDAVNEKWVNEDEAGGTISIELTKAEYDALSSAEKNDPTKVYYVKNYQPVPQGSNLEDLENVSIASLEDGQILKYDATNQLWINADESGGGGSVSELNDLDDVNVSQASVGQALVYNGVVWTGEDISVSRGRSISNVSPSTGWVTGASVTLPQGSSYIVFAEARFQAAQISGQRGIAIIGMSGQTEVFESYSPMYSVQLGDKFTLTHSAIIIETLSESLVVSCRAFTNAAEGTDIGTKIAYIQL